MTNHHREDEFDTQHPLAAQAYDEWSCLGYEAWEITTDMLREMIDRIVADTAKKEKS